MLATLLCLAPPLSAQPYPASWWTAVIDGHKPDWEILPQSARPGEVILSKRNELGILSNFAATPFTLRGKRYASVEGFWQMMLYPESPDDPRMRARELPGRIPARLSGRWSVSKPRTLAPSRRPTWRSWKSAGCPSSAVTFRTVHFPNGGLKGEHYKLIVQAMRAKLEQNVKVRDILLATGGLKLLPDHIQEPNAPPEWFYNRIWMHIRAELELRTSPSRLRQKLEP